MAKQTLNNGESGSVIRGKINDNFDELYSSTLVGLAPAKGNLVVGNGTAWIAVGVGTDNQVLTADSAQAAGVAWADASGGIGGSTGSTDNAIIRKDGTTGENVQASTATLSDTGVLYCAEGVFGSALAPGSTPTWHIRLNGPSGTFGIRSFYNIIQVMHSGNACLDIESAQVLSRRPFRVTNPTASTVAEIIKGAASQSANLTEWQNSSGTVLLGINSSGAIVNGNSTTGVAFEGSVAGSSSPSASFNQNGFAYARAGNFGYLLASSKQLIWGTVGFNPSASSVDIGLARDSAGCLVVTNGSTGAGILKLRDTTEPSTPTGGGVLYVESGALKYKGSSGTVTTLGTA